MLRFPRSAAAFAVLLTVAACNASDKAATSAVAIPDVEIPELSLATLQEVTKELSSDAYEGRAPGTAGEEKTVAYIIKKYEEAGLKPDRQSVVQGKGVSGRVDLGGRRIIKKKHIQNIDTKTDNNKNKK